jgi:hypothetical protein
VLLLTKLVRLWSVLRDLSDADRDDGVLPSVPEAEPVRPLPPAAPQSPPQPASPIPASTGNGRGPEFSWRWMVGLELARRAHWIILALALGFSLAYRTVATGRFPTILIVSQADAPDASTAPARSDRRRTVGGHERSLPAQQNAP